MARQSLSKQLADLREYTAKLEIELAGYRKINQRKSVKHVSFSERAIAYCKAHNVKSCTKEMVLNWRMA